MQQTFRYGIEHEVAFCRADGTFADFTNTRFEDFQQIVDLLPEYPHDQQHLRFGDAGIRRKRWYIEGYERFSETGALLTCVPKGIEIRTTIHNSISGVIAELQNSYQLLIETAARFGYTPIAVSHNPNHTRFAPDPPLNAFELAQQQDELPEERDTADIPMVTYGPDISLSQLGMSSAQLLDVAQKLTYYSPFLVPFSFSALPSLRTYQRTGARPAVLAFIDDPAYWLDSNPTLTKPPRHPAEKGRIEFKAFDTCANLNHYAALCALLKGLILDTTLHGRAITPDTTLHRLAAMQGWQSPIIAESAHLCLNAVHQALAGDSDQTFLQTLFAQLPQKLPD